MPVDINKLDESEKPFVDNFNMLEIAKELPAAPPGDLRALLIEYMKLTESYERLLKTAVRISRMGDKAQKKLIKYKELMDTLRNID